GRVATGADGDRPVVGAREGQRGVVVGVKHIHPVERDVDVGGDDRRGGQGAPQIHSVEGNVEFGGGGGDARRGGQGGPDAQCDGQPADPADRSSVSHGLVLLCCSRLVGSVPTRPAPAHRVIT